MKLTNLDYSYCNSLKLEICKNCKRNINLYDYLEIKNVWMFQPEIINENCETFDEV
jgi:hypothetical protein